MEGREGGRVFGDRNRVCVRVRCIVLMEIGKRKRINLGKKNRIVDDLEALLSQEDKAAAFVWNPKSLF